MPRTVVATAAALIAVLSLLTGTPAFAATSAGPSPQAQIDAAMAAMPGGTQTDADTVTWDGGTIELDVAGPNVVGSCATGSFCVYSGVSLSGSKISYAACGTYTVTAFTVKSIANARATGSVEAQNSSGTTLATVSAGGRLNTAPSGVTKVRC